MKSKNKTFVMMPFGGGFDAVYKKCIKPSVTQMGFVCVRADERVGPARIMDEIWQEINTSEILVADVTGKNPNVYYELGLAHALSKPVILITQNIKDIPFDIRHIRVIEYTNSQDGLSMLGQLISSSINEVSDESETHKKSNYIVLHSIQEVPRNPLKMCFLLGEHLTKFGAGGLIVGNPFFHKSWARDCILKANEYLTLIGVDFRFQDWMTEIGLEKKNDNSLSMVKENYHKFMYSALDQLYLLLEEKGRRFADSCQLGIKWTVLSGPMIWERDAYDNFDLVKSALYDHGEYLNLDKKFLSMIFKRYNRFLKNEKDFSPKKAANYFKTNRNKLLELMQ